MALPDGWKATSVRYVRSTDGLMTWHAGYQSPTGNYVAIEQTQGRHPRLGRGADQPGAPDRRSCRRPAGRGGRTSAGAKVQSSLLSTEAPGRRLTTIITGTGTFEELVAFAEALKPVQP